VEKRKEVRSEAELGERFSQGQEQGNTGQIRGRGAMGTATM